LGDDNAKIVLPTAQPHNKHIWNQYTLRVVRPGSRDEFKSFLGSKKIGCEIYYPVMMDQQKCFATTPAASRQGCEVAHQLAQEVVSIPIYPELSDMQKDEVIAAIAEFLG
jgi:dTDP-4-amino-4,6-dideoxygalactose transaminase